ncbi:hypothetical protein Tco_1033006 [Tanacetum coccineum]|uniref:Uncharacterized protein n=1 Tax=Tanacetum coccineum TaxID=301880 RepID=A0ABQ5GE13_9ASTR
MTLVIDNNVYDHRLSHLMPRGPSQESAEVGRRVLKWRKYVFDHTPEEEEPEAPGRKARCPPNIFVQGLVTPSTTKVQF